MASLSRVRAVGGTRNSPREPRGLRGVGGIIRRCVVVARQSVKGELRALRDGLRRLGDESAAAPVE